MPKMTQQIADQAASIAADRDRATERVMSDPNLSAVGKQQAVAKYHQQAVDRMDALRTNFEGGASITADQLGKQLFGAQQVSGADAISMRDAHDRAAQINDASEAHQLLDAAHMYGDEHLARAVAHRAYGLAQTPLGGAGWDQVLDTYASTRPKAAEQLQQYADARSRDMDDGLTAAFTFALPKPSVLSGMHDHQIATLAQQTAQEGA